MLRLETVSRLVLLVAALAFASLCVYQGNPASQTFSARERNEEGACRSTNRGASGNNDARGFAGLFGEARELDAEKIEECTRERAMVRLLRGHAQ